MPGIWHNKIEDMFPEEMREVRFYCGNRGSYINRRADILLNDQKTCEIQHSFISCGEIEERNRNWKTFGKDIIWLIDGCTDDVICEKLECGDDVITFKKSWKYKSFLKYDHVLLNINDTIYKFSPNMVKCGMVKVKEGMKLEDVIDKLKNDPNNIWNLWKDDNNVPCIKYIHQKGAGNGKTYGIWKSILENEDKGTFIIVTKQHSAKVVILNELTEQKGRGEYHIENMSEDTSEHTQKHYVIKYTHKKSNRESIVIIGTIDSLIYNLTNCEASGSNFFKNLLREINENGCNKLSINGHLRYANQNIKLNRLTELWIDEVQDLEEDYKRAIIKLMIITNIDVSVVGDILQSLTEESNYMTELLDNTNVDGIQTKQMTIENKNRRIKVKNLHTIINKLVHFEDYRVPKIELSVTST